MMQYPNTSTNTALSTSQQSQASNASVYTYSQTQYGISQAGFWGLLTGRFLSTGVLLIALLFGILAILFGNAAWANGTKKHLASAHTPTAYTLRIQLSPAVCALQPQRSSLRQCKDGYSMTVIGLRPEIQHTKAHKNAKKKTSKKPKKCSRTPAKLSPLQAKIISRIMPDKAQRDISWQHYGACSNMSSPQYFRMIAKLSDNLSIPPELSTGNDYVVSHQQFLGSLLKKNKQLQKKQVQLVCRQYHNSQSFVLTELQVCYDSSGKYHNCQQVLASTCPTQFTIRGLP